MVEYDRIHLLYDKRQYIVECHKFSLRQFLIDNNRPSHVDYFISKATNVAEFYNRYMSILNLSS